MANPVRPKHEDLRFGRWVGASGGSGRGSVREAESAGEMASAIAARKRSIGSLRSAGETPCIPHNPSGPTAGLGNARRSESGPARIGEGGTTATIVLTDEVCVSPPLCDPPGGVELYDHESHQCTISREPQSRPWCSLVMSLQTNLAFASSHPGMQAARAASSASGPSSLSTKRQPLSHITLCTHFRRLLDSSSQVPSQE